MTPITPRRFANFVFAFDLESFRAGRHIVRDERGFRMRDIKVSYIWIATVSPSFSDSEMVAMLRTSEGLFYATSPADKDGIPMITCPEVRACDDDPLYDFLTTTALDTFHSSISLDGTGYSLSIRGGADFDISFFNPSSPSLSALKDVLLDVVDTKKQKS